jgi:peptide/nickel transport system permease protein
VEAHVVSNVVALLLIAALGGGLVALGRNDLWRAAGRELRRRRPIALAVVGLYAAVALLDSLSWVGGAGEVGAGDQLALHKPRSVIDRLFAVDYVERSYSAPLAAVEFYGGEALRHPSSHLLGTDILGRDVLHLTLKGARIALLIGGLTSLIVIPLALLFGVSAGYFGGRIDDAVFFVVSVLASIPGLLLLIALIMVLGRGARCRCAWRWA